MLFDSHRFFHRRRRRLLAVILIVALAAAVVAAHSALSDGHMGETAGICLAVLGAGAAGVALAALPRPPVLRRPASVGLLRAAPGVLRPIVPVARAGPPLLQVFRL